MGNKKLLEHSVIRRVNQKLGRAIQKHDLIEVGDRIRVGLSGAKDFKALPETLAGRFNYHFLNYKRTAIHIGLESQPCPVDIDYPISVAKDLQIPFIRPLISVDHSDSHNHNPRFKCSWNRRKALFQVAQKSNISFTPPALPMVENRLVILRPLPLITEKEVKEFAFHKNNKREIKTCLHKKDAKRTEINNAINQLGQLIPNARANIYASMTNT